MFPAHRISSVRRPSSEITPQVSTFKNKNTHSSSRVCRTLVGVSFLCRRPDEGEIRKKTTDKEFIGYIFKRRAYKKAPMTSTDNSVQPSIGHHGAIKVRTSERLRKRNKGSEDGCWKRLCRGFNFVSAAWFIYQRGRCFHAQIGADGGAAGKLKNEWREPPWPRFDERESKTTKKEKITMALVPTTLSGNKWLFNISMHTKRQRKNEWWWIKQKEATRKGRGFSIISNEREREEICGVSNKTSSFYLMGAAAVMHPRGPHVNNWTDIGAAPAGSPNHRRSFEQTAVTLRHQAWQRSAAKHRRGGGERREGRGEKKKKGCIRGGERGPGLRSNEHISTEASRIHYLKIVSCLNKS